MRVLQSAQQTSLAVDVEHTSIRTANRGTAMAVIWRAIASNAQKIAAPRSKPRQRIGRTRADGQGTDHMTSITRRPATMGTFLTGISAAAGERVVAA